MKFRTLAAAALAATALSGGLAAQASAETIALVTINQQALFFNQINDGATKAAEAAGVELVIFNANNEPSAQNDAMETYISQGVDAIIIVAIDVNGVKPAITQAKEAGIPVIAIDAQIPEGDNDSFIGVDNMQAGRDIGQHFVDYVAANMGGSATVGIVGALNSFIQNQRLDGFVEVVEASGADITFLDTVDGQNKQDVALTAAENLMTANPAMNAIYATGEPALIGAIAAVESQGMTDQVKVFGWDLTAQAVKGIDEGWVAAVVQQSPYGEGEAAVEAAMTLIGGGTVEPIVFIPIDIVTKDNVDQFRGMFE
ncbi:MAG: substrate-binding domain-containing protein [Alphaproteobacteria bacterium]